MKFKKLSHQVIVITGATSGIGLATARAAASRGASLVISSRNESALATLAGEFNHAGCKAVTVTADVGHEADVRRIRDTALDAFGGFDTWVNNAGVSIYGRLLDVEIKDMRRLFETNFWGAVYGSILAARHLRVHGGALINVGSVLSDRSIPLQGIYCASKHALKGFTDALRMELQAERAPVAVTLVKPAGINTPYARHAMNYLSSEPKNPGPVYSPEVVAETILHCATHRVREVYAGGGGKLVSVLGALAPGLLDKIMERSTIKRQHSNHAPLPQAHQGLYQTSSDLTVNGAYPGLVMKSSLYTKASLHPLSTTALLLGAAASVVLLGRGPRKQRRKNKR
jgi:short-subunit dehydrogenase